MSEATGTLEALARELGRALVPLKDRLEDGEFRVLIAELGLDIPGSTPLPPALFAALGDAATAVAQLPPLLARLETAIENEELGEIVQVAIELIDKVARLVTSLEALGNALGAASGSLAGMTPSDVLALAGELAKRLGELALLGYLEAWWPISSALLRLLGLVEYEYHAGDPANPTLPSFTRRTLHLDRLSGMLSSPVDHFVDVYDWGSPGFDGQKLLRAVHGVLFAFALPARLQPVGGGNPLRKLTIFPFELVPETAPRGVRLRFAESLGSELHFELPFVDEWTLAVDLEGVLGPGVSLLFTPPGNVALEPAGGGGVGVTIGHAPAEPIVLLALDARSRIEIASFEAGVAFHFGGSQGTNPEIEVRAALRGGKAVFDTSGSDGFLQTVLSGLKIENTFNLGLAYSSTNGLRFEGGGSLDIQLASHVALGPIELTALTLSVGVEDGAFPVGITTNIKAALGPLSASVEEIGFELAFALAPDQKGNLGPLDVTPGFRPPKGAGLALDAGVVRGGGYLFFDPDAGEYAGAVELSIAEVVTVKAIGLITTRMPDGSQGFSLLLIMSVEFGTGIQLGFGFTLLAVGGLVGLNRTMVLGELMQGVRTGAIEGVMFPRDIIANAPRIISDLRRFFPPREGVFLIGPMAKLGWGTPTLVSVSLGIIIEIPGNIAILGVLKIAIPADDVALIVLQVNFAGAIEFDKKRIYFFAALFESRVVFLTLEGELGLLVAFGDDANFVVSVGGFHPRFDPPPLPFPSPKRITISLLNTPVARLTVEGYFAVTSNTVQFGARVDLFFGLDILNVKGHLAFDALFQFSPFYFIIEISASLSVNVFGAGLFSVSVRGSLDGPSPWHIKGHGSISILFWDVGVDFEETWGERRNTELPPITVMPLLQAELEKAETWRALLPSSSGLRVSLRKMPAEESAQILHPLGVLHLSQRALPLELTLDKVGAQKPSDVNRLSLTATSGLTKVADAFEQFAPAQFQDFSDSEKLSRPAFAPERSGVDLGATADLRSSRVVSRVVRYEEIILDSNFKRFQQRFKAIFATLFTFFAFRSSAARASVSQATIRRLQPFEEKIDVRAETFSVVFQSNNRAFAAESATFHSEASARDYLRQKVAEDPNLAEELHVVPGFERAA